MRVGTTEEAGVGEEKAGGMFLLGDRLERSAMIPRRIGGRIQTRRGGAQQSAQHGEGTGCEKMSGDASESTQTN